MWIVNLSPSCCFFSVRMIGLRVTRKAWKGEVSDSTFRKPLLKKIKPDFIITWVVFHAPSLAETNQSLQRLNTAGKKMPREFSHHFIGHSFFYEKRWVNDVFRFLNCTIRITISLGFLRSLHIVSLSRFFYLKSLNVSRIRIHSGISHEKQQYEMHTKSKVESYTQ